jgi:hypothetical protein
MSREITAPLEEIERLDRSLETADPAPQPVVTSTSRGSSTRSRRSTGRLLGVLTELRQMSGQLSRDDSIIRLSKQLAG